MFKDQVTTEFFLQDVFFMIGAVAVVLAIAGLGFVDSGLARGKNVLDTWLTKLVAALVTAFGFMFVGYGIWVWQFNSAFGVPDSLWQAIQDWWLGGPNLTHFAAALDPKVVPEADVLQVFFVFFVTFAMLIGAFLHSSGVERMKRSALFIVCFVTALVPWSFVTYLMWGSASPLTNRGVHDYVGVFNLYLFVGAFSVVMSWRLGPRIGAFKEHQSGTGPAPHDLGQVAAGVLLLMFAIPFIVLASGFLIPGAGYFGISMTTSGFGIALINVFVAYIGGGLSGALISYWQKNPIWILLGPLAGYISVSALADIGTPWKCLLVSIFGPVFALATYKVLRKLGIDDPKIAPLTLGPGLYGAIVAGFVGWGVKTGGYFGLTGTYGFQHARITPYWQLVGVGVTVGIAVISALVLLLPLEKTIGIRISEEEEIAGLDKTTWGVSAYSSQD